MRLFYEINDNGLNYCYAWRNTDQSLTEAEQKDKADSLKEILKFSGMLTDFVMQADNQGITFTGEDMGADKSMMTWLLYVVLAFVFSSTTKSALTLYY